MRKVIMLMGAVGVAGMCLFPGRGECRLEESLYDVLKPRGEIRVYVPDIESSEEIAAEETVSLKEALEDALVTRMTLNFKIVPRKEESDIVISCTVTDFLWTEEDPVDNITGIGPIVLDALVKEEYGRVRAVFAVTDAGTGKILWEHELKATITKKDMTRDQSRPLLNERIIKIFMRDCFSKTHVGR
ncbi:MAG: hypothetical protein ABIA77_04505 [Candidatus Omnitrophota bacterium]